MRPLHSTAATLCAAALLLASGCATTTTAAKTPPAPAASKQADPVLTKPNTGDNLLFVARSASATLDLDTEGEGTLELSSAPTMTWFSDRPQHDAGVTTTTDALAAFGWKRDGDDLGKDAPNAVLTGDNLPEAVVVELLTADRTGHGVTFTVKSSTHVRADTTEVKVTDAELFIDSVEPQILGMLSYTARQVEGRLPILGLTGTVRSDTEGRQAADVTVVGYWPFSGPAPDVVDKLDRYTFTLTEEDPSIEGVQLNLSGIDTTLTEVTFHPAVRATATTPAVDGFVHLSASLLKGRYLINTDIGHTDPPS